MKRLKDLTPDACRYPLGGPKDPPRLFCGAPSKDGSSYCEEHHTLCHQRHAISLKRILPAAIRKLVA
jgi:hypothetical protein